MATVDLGKVNRTAQPLSRSHAGVIRTSALVAVIGVSLTAAAWRAGSAGLLEGEKCWGLALASSRVVCSPPPHRIALANERHQPPNRVL